jgi:L-ascorbate metabolism protein UlaG (beta-lactamase superfamily)
MKITKFGHCCLLIEENGVRVLTDPGSYSSLQNDAKNIDVVVITHEHQDHYHIDSIRKILENNPKVSIITNNSVNALLMKDGIDHAMIVEDGQSMEVKGVKFAGYGKDHAEIYQDRMLVQNTGYMIGTRLYYPGDSFFNPKTEVEILALPVAGPWCKIKHSIDMYLEIMPKIIFPVHDGQLNAFGNVSIRNGQVAIVAKEKGIKFIELEIGKETEI